MEMTKVFACDMKKRRKKTAFPDETRGTAGHIDRLYRGDRDKQRGAVHGYGGTDPQSPNVEPFRLFVNAAGQDKAGWLRAGDYLERLPTRERRDLTSRILAV
jgi:hypothetical protein